MASNDRFLVAIVAGVLLLAAVAFALALHRPAENFHPDGPPEATVYNYLLALRKHDSARAYSYLASDLKGRPRDLAQFETDLTENDWAFLGFSQSYSGDSQEATTLRTDKVTVTGDKADVMVLETSFREGGLFGSSDVTDNFHARLRHEGGAWRLVHGDRYWYACWDDPRQCRSDDRRYSGLPSPMPPGYP